MAHSHFVTVLTSKLIEIEQCIEKDDKAQALNEFTVLIEQLTSLRDFYNTQP